tara:strand:+ start:791 stop:1069 length:279 start_codon:yes stop_codon:yes gene_type:complete
MENIIKTSDSLIGSLCREIEFIRLRSKVIKENLQNCRNKELTYRLKKEMCKLSQRKISILNLSKDLERNKITDNLSINFLIEIINRSFVYKN